jgi:glycerol-3-phosphate dehydrogenase
VHILVPDARVGNSGAVTLLHPRDQRVMFVLPGGRYTIIGTTDTRTDASPDQVRANATDVAYLLESANHFFPSARLTPDDVVTAWAGIRPLVASVAGGSAPTDQSREHEIDVGRPGPTWRSEQRNPVSASMLLNRPYCGLKTAFQSRDCVSFLVSPHNEISE